MTDPGLALRTLTPAEVDRALDWAAGEGWNPGLRDAPCFLAADPDGFLGAFLGDRLVATLSVVAYDPSFAFLGFYIVDPAFRGRGYGLALWREGMARAGERVVGLDGVLEQQANYARSGFVLAHRNARYQGLGGPVAPPDPGIVPLSGLPLAQVLAYDRPCFPAPREAFLAAWLGQPGATALGLLEEGRLAGYGVVRPCREGCKVGPLFADGEDLAERLLVALAARVPEGQPLFLDTPLTNPAAVALAERHGMRIVFETARMYRGPAPALPMARWYGVTTFELG